MNTKPTCEICQQNESKWPCPKCGRRVCEKCITDEFCLICYSDSISEEMFGFSVEPKLSVTKFSRFARWLAVGSGVLVPYLALPVGVLYSILAKDKEQRTTGRVMAISGLVSLTVIAAILKILHVEIHVIPEFFHK